MHKKFKVKSKYSQLTVTEKIDKKDIVNQRDINILTSKLVFGLMRVSLEERGKIKYLAPDGICLREYLEKGVDKDSFFMLLSQIVEVIKSISKNGLMINGLVFDLDYSFINIQTKQIYFIYRPIVGNSSGNFLSYLFEIITIVKQSSVDASFANEFASYMSRFSKVSLADIEKYIVKVCPQAFRMVSHQKPEKSARLQNENDIYYRRNDWEKEQKKQEEESTNITTYIDNEDEESTSLLEDFEEDEDENTSLLTDFEEDEDDSTSLLTDFEEDEDENTSLLADFEEDEEETSLLEQADVEETTALDAEDSDETTLLSNIEKQNDEAVSGLIVEKRKSYPYLIRKKNYDRVDINKPSFRIGKERSYVDYFIFDNNAISRIHADIITKGNRFFIKDNNSTNGTYVNDKIVYETKDIEIFDGDEIILANEVFEFHTND